MITYLQATYGQVGEPFYYLFNDINGNPLTLSKTNFVAMILEVNSYNDAVFEQLLDQYQITIQGLIDAGTPNTYAWIQQAVLNFQYSASVPQIATLDTTTLIPSYAVVNPALRIITQCAVVPNTALPGSILIKCSVGGTPLSSPQLASLNSYLLTIMPPIHWTVISVLPDLFMCGADVYYNGQYNLTFITTNVENAINNYLSSLPFNGTVVLSDLEKAVKAIAGVSDFVLRQIEAYGSNTTSVNAVKLVNAYTLIKRNYSTYSGQVIIDTNTGRTLADTLIFNIG